MRRGGKERQERGRKNEEKPQKRRGENQGRAIQQWRVDGETEQRSASDAQRRTTAFVAASHDIYIYIFGGSSETETALRRREEERMILKRE